MEIGRTLSQHGDASPLRVGDAMVVLVAVVRVRDEYRVAVCAQGCQMAKFDPFLSLDCVRVEGGVGAQSKERKGSNFAAQRSGAIVQKPKGPNTYDLKNWL